MGRFAFGWSASAGCKHKQQTHVPDWIIDNKQYHAECLRGLIITDGSIYTNRGYPMVNFTSIIKKLAEDVAIMIKELGLKAHIYKIAGKTAK